MSKWKVIFAITREVEAENEEEAEAVAFGQIFGRGILRSDVVAVKKVDEINP